MKRRKAIMAMRRGAALPDLSRTLGLPLKKLQRWKRRFQGQAGPALKKAGKKNRVVARPAKGQKARGAMQRRRLRAAGRRKAAPARAGRNNVNKGGGVMARRQARLGHLQSRMAKLRALVNPA